MPLAYLLFSLSISFTYFSYDENMLHENTSQSKILIVPEEGWFGQPGYGTPSKKSSYVESVSAFTFFILYVKPIRSLLIQRIPAGSSFRLLA